MSRPGMQDYRQEGNLSAVHTDGHPDRQAGKQGEQAGMEIRRHEGMKRWLKGRIGSINAITTGRNALIYIF
jgi:hypothetical protein